MVRLRVGLVVLVLLAVSLAGCGGQSEAENASDAALETGALLEVSIAQEA
jgi:hypothetical protein